MSKSRQGGLSKHAVNKEWGRKARKEEAEMRGLNNTARREAIEDQIDSTFEEPVDPIDYDELLPEFGWRDEWMHR